MDHCNVPGCLKIKDSFGMCGMHYRRHKRHGDVNFVTSEEQRRILRRAADPRLGQVKKHVYKKFLGRHEHRVVAEKTLGRPLLKGEIVHHIDGNKHNNNPENLKVMTQSQHIAEHREEMNAKRLSNKSS